MISSPRPAITELFPPFIVIVSFPFPDTILLPRFEPIIMSSLVVPIIFFIPILQNNNYHVNHR